MEVSVRELIRETKNAVNARFDMLEHVLNISNVSTAPVNDNSKLYELLHQQNDEIDSIKTMLYRFNDVISNIMKKIETMENHKVKELTPLPSLSELLPHLVITPKPQLTTRSHHDDEEQPTEYVVSDEKMLEEEEAEEAEEGIELEEFEYKGMTLYRDTENKVYRMDEDGALSDPLGLWDEVKQRIKKL